MEKLIENISRYLETRIELIKVDAQQKVAGAIVSAVEIGLIAFTVLFTIVFASLALANYLNSVIGNSFAGHLIVAGFYLLLCIIAIASRKAIQTRAEKITDDMFSSKEEESPAHDIEVVVDNPYATSNGVGSNMDLNEPVGRPGPSHTT